MLLSISATSMGNERSTGDLTNKQRYLITGIFWAIALLLGGIQVWTSRYSLSTGDAVSYLDIADAYWQGDWEQAVNAYFSPLYSWLLGFVLHTINPSSYWEFFVVKLTNLLIFGFNLICFDFCLREFIRYYGKQASSFKHKYFVIPEWTWLILGYLLFLWTSLKWIGVNTDTPDMIVAALIYLATAFVLRVHVHSDGWLNFVGLGATVGFGYLAKTFMFPMAFIFLGTSFFSIGNLRRAIPRTLVALGIFVLIVAPWIWLISIDQGELTFGTTGKLNYAWNVSPGGIYNHYWRGETPGSGTPEHPIRKIFDNPTVYEFSTPIGGTYPPWYDPSYWGAGIASPFNLPKQLAVFWKHVIEYYQVFGGILIFGYAILVCVSGKFWLSLKNILGNWRLVIPACAGLGSLMLVHVHPRLIASLVALLFAAVFSSVRLPPVQESKRLMVGLTVGLLFLVGGQLIPVSFGSGNHIHWKIARGIEQLDIHSGDEIAILGSYRVGHAYYWARLARLKIVAEIPSIRNFWRSEPETRSDIYQTLEQVGAKALVMAGDNPSDDQPASGWQAISQPELLSQGWQEIGDTGYYIHFLVQ